MQGDILFGGSYEVLWGLLWGVTSVSSGLYIESVCAKLCSWAQAHGPWAQSQAHQAQTSPWAQVLIYR